MVGKRQRFALVVGQIGDDQLERVDHCHAAGRGGIEVFAQATFEHREIDQ